MPKKRAKKLLPVIYVAPIAVGVHYKATNFHGGRDGYTYGKLITEATIQGGRFDVANKLRDLADVIAGTTGDDVKGGYVVVLLR